MYINPPSQSKINGVQVVIGTLMVLAAINPKLIPLLDAANDPKIQNAVVTGIALTGQIATVIFRTWYTVK